MSKCAQEWFLLIIVIIAAFLIAEQRDDLKIEAVKHGAAEWVSDVNGRTTFKWKEKQ
jgi:hypothetical protein